MYVFIFLSILFLIGSFDTNMNTGQTRIDKGGMTLAVLFMAVGIMVIYNSP